MTIATVYHRRESALHAGICSSPECDEITVDPTCRRCIHRLRLALVRVVDLGLGVELDLARRRGAVFTRPADRTRGGERPMMFDPDAARIASALHSTLVSWVRDVAEDLDREAPLAGPVCAPCTVRAECRHISCRTARGDRAPLDRPDHLARWLLDHLLDIGRRDDGGIMVDEVEAITAEAERTVDLPPSTVLAGSCPECSAPVYAHQGAALGRCTVPECEGTVRTDTGRADHLDALAEAEFTAAEVARVMTALGEPVTRNQVAQWHARGTITPSSYATARSTKRSTTIDQDGAAAEERRRPRFRLADVRARRRTALAQGITTS
jgi:uncharacterized Zn finger protein (UPF0148 family)